ncbi:hypothetical protein [Skermanella pratensis]|uniref:hypothetical protein n=1 Tax=Skermanella pratensis TaxID=2233999 RepID=UPI0013013038|nr:hypothetical protein [Skermanella pratensis]
MEETKVTAALPTATVEMTVREHRDGGSEVMTISIRATPSFQSIGEAFRPAALMWANPVGLWMQMAALAWQPWLDLAGSAAARQLPKPDGPATR